MEEQADYITEQEIADANEMLGKGYEEVRVKDESNDHKYFTITPRVVKAYARNAHDLALWETVKDIAGEAGECYLNTEQLAILSGISMGQVYNSRRYWMKIGFLKGELRKDPGYSQKVWHLSIPDLWAKNIEWCEKFPKIADRIAFRKAHKSFHTVKASKKVSGDEKKLSPDETKKREVKNTKSLIIKEPLELFKGYFGKFLSKKELDRWQILYEATGRERAEELASWALKKEIHLTNRPGLIDSLETAAKNWREKPQRANGKAPSPPAEPKAFEGIRQWLAEQGVQPNG